MVTRVISVLLLSIPFILSSPSNATTLMSVSTQEMSQNSAWIGEVQIESVADKVGAFPMREFTARVVDVLKGSLQAGEILRFQIPGGKLASRRISIMGMAELKPNYRYLVFLDRPPGSALIGLQNWGAYEIREVGQERIAVKAGSLGIARRLNPNSNALSITHDERNAVRLDDLKNDIFRGLN